MGIVTQWYNTEQTVLYHLFESDWTWEDLFASWDETLALIQAAARRIDSIVDMRQAEKTPNYAFEHVWRAVTYRSAPNTGLNVVVGANGFIRHFWRMFTQLYSNAPGTFHVVFVNTLEEAQEMLTAYHTEQL